VELFRSVFFRSVLIATSALTVVACKPLKFDLVEKKKKERKKKSTQTRN
jgi:hypothetical protein